MQRWALLAALAAFHAGASRPVGALLISRAKAAPGLAPTETSVAPDLLDVFAFNQGTRSSVKHWVTPEAIRDSAFQFGTWWEFASTSLVDTGDAPLQHDFISQLGARLQARGQRVRYLEIGASVLKSIYTQVNFLHNASVTAVDLDDPNPTVESLLGGKVTLASWSDSDMPKGLVDSRREKGRLNYINRYDGPRGNTVHYLAGDAFNMATHDHLRDLLVARDGPMNLVLSDGAHSGAAVTAEIEGLLSRGIIRSLENEDFAMVWDDCDDGYDVRPAVFSDIIPRLRAVFAGRPVCSGLFVIPGWAGKNEYSHKTCIFSTLDLSGPHLGASSTWVAQGAEVQCS